VNFKIIQFAQHLEGRLAFFLCLAGLLGAPAAAQVISIGPGGSVTTYAGPVMATPEGIRPIAPIAPIAPGATATTAAGPVKALIRDAATRHQLSEQLVEAVAWQESRLQQKAVSPKGARGVMQLMPRTAQALGVDAASLDGNIDGGAAYLAAMMQRFDGDIREALAAYDAGPDAVTRYGGVPPYRETQAYVDAILGRLAAADTNALREIQP
jgi:soluble lytic murein transglycosylase-like protein